MKLYHSIPFNRVFAPAVLTFVLFAAWVVVAAPSTGARPVQEPGAKKVEEEPPRVTVRGRVIYEETNKPVRRARLMLVSFAERGGEHGGLTDARGEFVIKNVQAGSYFAVVDVPGIVSPIAYLPLESMRTGAVPLDQIRKHFDEIVVDGKNDEEVTVLARRGGVITGKVTYADGDPAVNITIHVMRRGENSLAKVLTGINIGALASLRTDDRGVYRVSGLPPGEYVVAVSETAAHGDEARVREDDLMGRGMVESLLNPQFLMTYYPSATSAKEATAVKVEAGEEREGVDISIAERALRSLAGLVRGRRDKRPLAGATVVIFGRGQVAGPGGGSPFGESGQNTARTDAEGRWLLKEIPDGSYTLLVTPADEYETGVASINPSTGERASVSTRRRKKYAPLRQDVSVASDVAELVVELGEGGSVSGKVLVEGGKQLPEYTYISVTPVLQGGEGRFGMELPNAEIRKSEFTIEGIQPGKFFLQPSAHGLERAGLYVKSITWRGRNLLREPIEIGDGETVEGVVVIVAPDPSTLTVRAITSERKPARSLYVLLAPADMIESAINTQQLNCVTDGTGACSIKAAPGEYLVIAPTSGEASGTFEELIRRQVTTAPRITLQPGETKVFELVVPER